MTVSVLDALRGCPSLRAHLKELEAAQQGRLAMMRPIEGAWAAGQGTKQLESVEEVK
jgi:hypothetical protein